MSATQATPARDLKALDARAEFARPDALRFAMLAVPLGLFLAVFKVYKLEEPAFFLLAEIVFAGFAVSYWLPLRFKQDFLTLLSLAGAFFLLEPLVAGLLLAAGAVIFGIVRSGLRFNWKLGVLLAILAILAYGRASGQFHLPHAFWPVFGSVFLVRIVVYLYDVKHQRGPADLREFINYFFLLPNYYFLLFPVVDFQTFRKSFLKRDIHTVAQEGVWWIFRGATHLLLYRLVYQMQPRVSPPHLPAALAVVSKMVICYLLYLRVSGQFHIIVGMLHLFGYDLPETNRRYLLSSSLSDYWRRINIYWKDFMVKVVYYPAYFRLRRSGDLRARLVATAMVFLVTWFLHAYQFFWVQGEFRVSWNDTLYWVLLGSLVVVDVWLQDGRGKRPPLKGWEARARTVLQTAATFAFVSLLWSLWSAASLKEWFYFLKTGNG